MTTTMFVREDRGDIAVVRMAHGKVNALDARLCDAMVAEVESLERAAARALVLTGTGSAFSAGVDLFQVLEGGPEYLRTFLPSMDRFFRSLLLFAKPLVAALNGHAIAGGCIIAAAADYRVMARGHARIGVPELAVGVPFPRLPLEIVSSRLPPALIRSLVYTGRTVQPDEAVTVGFVDELADASELLDRGLAVARQLASIPPRTFALTKRAMTASVIDRVRASRDDEVMDAWTSPEVHAAIRQYLEKTIRRT